MHTTACGATRPWTPPLRRVLTTDPLFFSCTHVCSQLIVKSCEDVGWAFNLFNLIVKALAGDKEDGAFKRAIQSVEDEHAFAATEHEDNMARRCARSKWGQAGQQVYEKKDDDEDEDDDDDDDEEENDD